MKKHWTAVLCIACLCLVHLLPPANAREKLTVAVCYEGYFTDTLEAAGLAFFKEKHPDCEVEVIIHNGKPDVESKADVYIFSSTTTNIYAALRCAQFVSIADYVSAATRKDCLLTDFLQNTQGELVAIPLFAGTYMIYTQDELITAHDPLVAGFFMDGVMTWERLYQRAVLFGYPQKSSNAFMGGISFLAQQLNLMAYVGEEINFETQEIMQTLSAWKGMYESGLLRIPPVITLEGEAFPPADLMTFQLNRMFMWWDNPGFRQSCYTIPGIEKSNSNPTSLRAGFVSRDCGNIALAVAFLESFVQKEVQMTYPFSSSVRGDMVSIIKENQKQNTEWFKEMCWWWGKPISESSYRAYEKARKHSRVSIGSFEQNLRTAGILSDYLTGKINQDTALARFETTLRAILEAEPL